MCYDSHPDDCPICEGTGYLLDQTYGYADIPDGWLSVQACDECGQYDDDSKACCAAAYDAGGVAWAFFFGGSFFEAGDHQVHYARVNGLSDVEIGRLQLNGEPGDYAIEIYVPLARWAALR